MRYTLNQARKDHPVWFSPETMSFFQSRVCDATARSIAGCVLVVTSERCRWDDASARRYSVRKFSREGIETVGAFQAYATRARAIRALAVAAEVFS